MGKCVAKIIRRITLVAVGKDLFLILNNARRRELPRAGIVCRVYGRGVNKRLKDRPRLTHRVGRAVELVSQVISSADHRDDLAGLWTDGDKRGVEALLFGEMLVEGGESFVDDLVRDPLKVWIDGCVNPQMLQSLGIDH